MPPEHPAFLGAGCSVLGLLSHSPAPRRGGQTSPLRAEGPLGPLPHCSAVWGQTEEATQEQRGF